VRFVFVDRIVAVAPGRSVETLRNVSATEDVFADHFPGCPILPGALVVEAFGQAAELLIGMSHDWKKVGRLVRLSARAARLDALAREIQQSPLELATRGVAP
jgi:3-hydroxymyristoyl/3-hydroxydecanoyl-(acyl carrier protein) dehydratase